MSEAERIALHDRKVAARARFGGILVTVPGAGALTVVAILLVLFALSSAHGAFASSPVAAAVVILALLFGRDGIVGQKSLCIGARRVRRRCRAPPPLLEEASRPP